MADTVTIEGSLTPCVKLARGERKTVRLTESVQRLIDRGFVNLIERFSDGDETEFGHDSVQLAADESVPPVEPLVQAPATAPDVEPSINDEPAVWETWLSEHGIKFPKDANVETLATIWQQAHGGS